MRGSLQAWLLAAALAAAGASGLRAGEPAGPETELRRETFDEGLLARLVFAESNRVRRELGLRELLPSAAADEAAMIQARLGFVAGQAGHTNPFPPVGTVGDRIRWVGLPAVAVSENIARTPVVNLGTAGQFAVETRDGRSVSYDMVTGKELELHTYASFARDVVRRWLESPGHRENLLRPEWDVLGCAVQMGVTDAGADMVNAVQVFAKLAKNRGR